MDEWIYINYFIDLSNDNNWNGYYKASRIPYNAIGNLGFKVIGYEKFLVLLHWAYLSIFLALIFILVHRYINSNYALMISFLLTLSAEFHGSGGWLYQNTMAILLLILAYVLIVGVLQKGMWSNSSKNPIFHFYLIAISVVSTNLLIVNTLNILALIPLFFILALTLRGNSITKIILKFSSIMLGFFGTVIFWATYSNVMGFRFRFWQPLLDTFINYSSGYHQVWHKSFFDLWWLNSNYSYVSLMAVAMLFSFAYLFRMVRFKNLKPGDFLILLRDDLLFLLSFISFIINITWVLAYILKLHILEFDYHALPAILFSLLFILTLVTKSLEKIISKEVFVNSKALKYIPFISLLIAYFSLEKIEFFDFFVIPFTKNTLFLSMCFFLIIIALNMISKIQISNKLSFMSPFIIFVSLILILILLNLVNLRSSSKYNANFCNSNQEATYSVVEWVLATRQSAPIYVFFDSQDLLYSKTKCSYPIENLGNSLVETGNFKLDFPMGSNPGFSVGLKSNQKLIGILTSNDYNDMILKDELKINSYKLMRKLPGVDVDQDGMFPVLKIYFRD